MAAFNFPNSPSTNDLHTENGVTYKWNGTVWKRQNASYTDATNLNVTGIATFANNVSIGGILTYEDVKNVDSVGVITARSNVYIKNTYPRLYFQDTDSNSDFSIINSNGAFMIYDDTNSANRFTINSNGIGAFNSDLEVAGSHYITDSIIHTGDTNTKIRFPAADTITAETGGSEILRITSAGQVLIGTTTAGVANLMIYGDGTNDNKPATVYQNSGTGTGDGNGFYVGINHNNAIGYVWNYETQPLVFATSNTERLTITSDGKLLLKKTSSSWGTSTDNTLIQLENSAIWDYAGVQFDVGHNYYYDGTDYHFIRSGYACRQTFHNNTGHIAFWSGGTGSADGSLTWVERLRLDSTGALGLGYTPENNTGNYRQLQIGLGAHFYGRTDDTPIYISSNAYRDGSNWKYTANTTVSQITMGTNIVFSNAASGTAGNTVTLVERLRIDSAGRMGLGVSPTASHSNVTASIFLKDGNTLLSRTGGQFLGLFQNIKYTAADVVRYISNGYASAYHQDTGVHKFFTTAASGTGNTSATLLERLRIMSDGRICMGSTNVGSGSADDLNIENTSDHGGITIRTPNNKWGSVHFADGGTGNELYRGQISYDHANDCMRFYVGAGQRLLIGSGGGHNFYNDGSGYYAGNLTECNNDNLALNVRLTRQGQTKGIALGAIGSASATAIQAYDSSNNSANNLVLNPFGAHVGVNQSSPQYCIHASHNGQGSNERIDLHLTNATTGHASGDGVQFGYQNTAGAYIWNYENTPVYFGTNNNTRLTITAGGNVLIGTGTDSSNKMTLYGTNTSVVMQNANTGTGSGNGFYLGNGANTICYVWNYENEAIRWATNNIERMRLNKYGWMKIKGNKSAYLSDDGDNYHEILSDKPHNVTLNMRHDSSNGYGIIAQFNHAKSTHYAYRVYDFANSNDKCYIRTDGDLENSNNSYGSISDIKLKENIIDAKSQWDDIKALKVRNFNFKTDPSKKMLGLVAQEAEAVCPSLVKTQPDIGLDNEDLGTETKVLKYSILYMKAIKALQESMTRIETLEAEVAALKGS